MTTTGWFLARPGGTPVGPLRAEALLSRLRDGTLSPVELVWCEGLATWSEIKDVPELASAIPPETSAPSSAPDTERDPPPDAHPVPTARGPATPNTPPRTLAYASRGPMIIGSPASPVPDTSDAPPRTVRLPNAPVRRQPSTAQYEQLVGEQHEPAPNSGPPPAYPESFRTAVAPAPGAAPGSPAAAETYNYAARPVLSLVDSQAAGSARKAKPISAQAMLEEKPGSGTNRRWLVVAVIAVLLAAVLGALATRHRRRR